MPECSHMITQGREGEPSGRSWCKACGVQVWEVHDRPCNECRHYKDMGEGQIPICRKHLMGVTRTMHVTYKLTGEPRLCFEADAT